MPHYHQKMIPTLHDVTSAIVLLTRRTDKFLPSDLRRQMAINFGEVDAGVLSARIQPHLRDLRTLGVVSIVPTNQRRNRPYQIDDKQKLIHINENKDYIIPILDRWADHDDEPTEKIETAAQINDYDELLDRLDGSEQRILALEETIAELQEKLIRVSILLGK
jgi:vacuolar-type H+-ATPase subunit I/STV1